MHRFNLERKSLGIKRRHLLVGAGVLTSFSITSLWQKQVAAQPRLENVMTTVQDLSTVLRKAAQRSQANTVTVTETEVIGFDAQAALAFITMREAESASDTAIGTRTVVVKTSDDGVSWRETLNTDTGSVVIDELFFLSNDDNGNIKRLWMITQWEIEGTYPTLYWTTDFGKTWQKSNAIDEFLRSKGHSSVSYAEGLRFRNESEGIVIAKGNGSEVKVYFLQTRDSGKTWEEIQAIPPWYFEQNSLNWRKRNLWTVNKKEEEFSIMKPVGGFLQTLKS
ncbi:WD40/YVTN/BNR-like repeat-containing protein [Nostoc sp.]|uniref:WD40/YVTN/BNR-like repeat-containing protein n=1 Tax=Nostoc sp. TaxID=1180 RepID=UPI003593B0E4